MKRCICLVLFLLLLLTACTPTAEVTPEPTPSSSPPPPVFTWWVTSPEPTTTPEPTPEPTPFLSYEDYFSQRIYYGTTTDDQDLHDIHISYDPEEVASGVALAQELVPDDPWGLIPQTLEWVADRCLYFFWAGGQDGLSLYRLYAPSKTLDCLYAIPEEELENYFYTPQTETVADWIWYTCQSGEQKCLLINRFGSYSNYEILWWSYNKEFLELFDRVMAHPEEYPDCFEGEDGPRLDINDIVFYLERHVGMCSNRIAHYLNADSGRYDTRPCGVYMDYGYWWERGE